MELGRGEGEEGERGRGEGEEGERGRGEVMGGEVGGMGNGGVELVQYDSSPRPGPMRQISAVNPLSLATEEDTSADIDRDEGAEPRSVDDKESLESDDPDDLSE